MRAKSLPAASLVFAGFLTISQVHAVDDYIWVEAESALEKVEHTNDWYDPVDRYTSLSENDWWRSFDEIGMKSGYCKVHFTVAEAGTYRLWIRLNTTSTGYRYALDDEETQELPLGKWRDDDRKYKDDINHKRRVFDETFVAHDGSNRHRLVWVLGPELNLTAGAHTLRFQVQPNKQGKGFAAVDCFVLAAQGFAFRPRMHYKPEEKVQISPEIGASWPIYYKNDPFEPSPIDLRYLNEKVAGEHGFIKRSPDGMGFIRGDGKPIRFWSGSEYAWRIPFKDKNLKVSKQEEADVAHKARWSAKRGMNMVRFHGHLPPSKRR